MGYYLKIFPLALPEIGYMTGRPFPKRMVIGKCKLFFLFQPLHVTVQMTALRASLCGAPANNGCGVSGLGHVDEG